MGLRDLQIIGFYFYSHFTQMSKLFGTGLYILPLNLAFCQTCVTRSIQTAVENGKMSLIGRISRKLRRVLPNNIPHQKKESFLGRGAEVLSIYCYLVMRSKKTMLGSS